jgi:putative transposase
MLRKPGGSSLQRCWFHKIANVLNALPKSAQPGAKTALAEIWNAEDRDHAQTTARTFADTYGAKWPKAAAKIADELDVLLAFAMAFKLIESSQRRWRAVNAPHLVALVRAGAHFDKGRLVERPDDQPTTNQEMTLKPRERSICGWPTRSAR